MTVTKLENDRKAAVFAAENVWRELTVLAVLIPLLLAIFPSPAHAGVFSDLKSFLQSKVEASSDGHTKSVQSMSLLKPAINLDPNPAKGGGDVIVEDGSALRAQGGFSGETIIPQKDAISVYVVGEGDTLSEIAAMFDVSVNTIIWANDLPASGRIAPGQKLTILPVTGVKYTVKKGDTLKSIATKYQGDADEIAQYNGLLQGVVAAGDQIIIPNGRENVEVAVSSKTKAVASKSSPSYAGYYTNPLIGAVKTQGVHGTNGVDLAVPSNSHAPIVASAGGEVIIALEGGWNGGYGSYVVIKHDNGSQTLYAHMSSVAVGKGQLVSQGETIGTVGNSGRSTGPHLHFEIRGGPRNPF